MNPAARLPLHGPQIIALGAWPINRNNDLVLSVTIEITGHGELGGHIGPGTVDVSVEGMPGGIHMTPARAQGIIGPGVSGSHINPEDVYRGLQCVEWRSNEESVGKSLGIVRELR
jgi:hypothetical protein